MEILQNIDFWLWGYALFGGLALLFFWPRQTPKEPAPETPAPEPPTPHFRPAPDKNTASLPEEPLLSSDEMIISSELPMLSAEDQRLIETQPIPLAKGEKPPEVIVSQGTAPLEFNLNSFVKMLRSRMLTPLDFEFPPMMTVVDRPAYKLFPVALVDRKSRTEEVVFSPDVTELEVLKWTPNCRACDAYLFIRPFVRVLWPKEDWALDHLRSMRGTVKIDGEPVANDVPIDAWIVNFEGHGLTALPYKFVGSGSGVLFWGHEYKEVPGREEAYRPNYPNYHPPEPHYGRDPSYGIGAALGPALIKDSELTISLSRATAPTIRIVVGCVMALYSSAP